MPHLVSSRLSLLRTALITLVCLFFSLAAWGHKDAGSIVGTVKDQTGAIVAHAKVTVSDVKAALTLRPRQTTPVNTWPARCRSVITQFRWSTRDSSGRLLFR